MCRTKQQVQAQISGLLQEKETYPPVSVLGTPNWGGIEAQIKVLKGKATAEDYTYTNVMAPEWYLWFCAHKAECWLSGLDEEPLYN